MAAITSLSDPDVVFNMAQSVLDSIVEALENCNLAVPERRYVGYCSPPNDCCPDLVVWADAPRPDDLGFDQGLTRGYFRCTNRWVMDINVRLGICYVDQAQNGDPLSSGEISDLSKQLYRYWQCMYIRWACQAQSGSISELSECEKFGMTRLSCYAEGGCAGLEFTITVPLDN